MKVERWHHKADYVFANLCHTMRMSKFLRVPVMVNRYGGGTFFATYVLVTAAVALPMLYLQVCLAQLSSSGNRGVLDAVPLLRGFVYSKIFLRIVLLFPNAVLTSAAMSYFVSAVESPMPWTTCMETPAHGKSDCYDINRRSVPCIRVWAVLAKSYEDRLQMSGIGVPYEGKVTVIPYDDYIEATANCSRGSQSAAAVFFSNMVMNFTGAAKVETNNRNRMTFSLLLVWLFAFTMIIHGLAEAKIPMYFFTTGSFIIVVLVTVKALASGSPTDVFQRMHIDFTYLYDSSMWNDVLEQSLYGSGVSDAVIYKLASLNHVNTDFRPYVQCTVWIDFIYLLAVSTMFTAIIASGEATFRDYTYWKLQDITGLELMFVSIPEVIATWTSPHTWSLLYFLLLSMCSIGGLLIFVECILEVVLVDIPRSHMYKSRIRFCICMFLFVTELPLTTQYGPSLMIQLHWYSSKWVFTVMAVLEAVGLAQVYGVRRIALDFELLTREPPNQLLKVFWLGVIPVMPSSIFIAQTLQTFYNEERRRGENEEWTEWLATGILLFGLSIVPVYAINIIQMNGFVWLTILRPTPDWGPKNLQHSRVYQKRLLRAGFLRRKSSSAQQDPSDTDTARESEESSGELCLEEATQFIVSRHDTPAQGKDRRQAESIAESTVIFVQKRFQDTTSLANSGGAEQREQNWKRPSSGNTAEITERSLSADVCTSVTSKPKEEETCVPGDALPANGLSQKDIYREEEVQAVDSSRQMVPVGEAVQVLPADAEEPQRTQPPGAVATVVNPHVTAWRGDDIEDLTDDANEPAEPLAAEVESDVGLSLKIQKKTKGKGKSPRKAGLDVVSKKKKKHKSKRSQHRMKKGSPPGGEDTQKPASDDGKEDRR